MQYQISVIISIYNIEKYISCCVDSVLKQSYHDYEIILVNDGSCDKSGAICQEYAERFPNIIRYVYKENGGLSDFYLRMGIMYILLMAMIIYCLIH